MQRYGGAIPLHGALSDGCARALGGHPPRVTRGIAPGLVYSPKLITSELPEAVLKPVRELMLPAPLGPAKLT